MNKKNYNENLEEINYDELFDGLLGYGLFSEMKGTGYSND